MTVMMMIAFIAIMILMMMMSSLWSANDVARELKAYQKQRTLSKDIDQVKIEVPIRNNARVNDH
jgi:CHASE3 domain sensor protein